jgi:hypothetical protein
MTETDHLAEIDRKLDAILEALKWSPRDNAAWYQEQIQGPAAPLPKCE